MTLKKIVSILDCQVLTGEKNLAIDIKTGCGCDLMRDVLAYIKPEALLLTGLSNAQAIRTAEISEIRAICFVRGKQPSEEMVLLAEEKGIPLLTTALPMFEACGRLYNNGLAGCSEYRD